MYYGQNLTSVFADELTNCGYLPSTVKHIPAFLITDTAAFFGRMFSEQVVSWELHKLWGSVIRNEKGNLSIQIPPRRPTIIYANQKLTLEMDIDHPAEF